MTFRKHLENIGVKCCKNVFANVIKIVLIKSLQHYTKPCGHTKCCHNIATT